MRLRLLVGTILVGLTVGSETAQAQLIGQPLIDPALPLTYDRGRNVSVLERKRPEYDALGINLGGFTLFPTLETRVGQTDNVYQSQDDRISDAFVTLAPRASLRSNWRVHALRLDAGSRLVRYFDQNVRNENAWYVGASGTYDATADASLSASVRTAKDYETRFSSVAIPDVRQANPYQSTTVRILGKLAFARSRLLISSNFARLNYQDVSLFSGGRLDQNNRDRDIAQGAVRYEYGVTPDTSVFAEASYTRTQYDRPLTAFIPNRNSAEWSGVAGVSFDLSALLRGTMSVGYVNRDFNAANFRDISGLSVGARIEYFPTELTTVTIGVRREVEDANLTASSGYFANSVAVRVDHELLRNLLLNVATETEIDDYIGVSGNIKIFRATGGARYLLNNSVSLTGELRYAKRNSTVPTIGADISERRATIGIVVQR